MRTRDAARRALRSCRTGRGSGACDFVVLRASHISLRTALASLGDGHRSSPCYVLLLSPRSGRRRGSMGGSVADPSPSAGGAMPALGLIPVQPSEHKGIMGIPRSSSSRTKSSSTSVSPSYDRTSASSAVSSVSSGLAVSLAGALAGCGARAPVGNGEGAQLFTNGDSGGLEAARTWDFDLRGEQAANDDVGSAPRDPDVQLAVRPDAPTSVASSAPRSHARRTGKRKRLPDASSSCAGIENSGDEMSVRRSAKMMRADR